MLSRTLAAARAVIGRVLGGAVTAAGVTRQADGTPVCRCGRGRAAHMHYRRGSDCALCGCPRWSPGRPHIRAS